MSAELDLIELHALFTELLDGTITADRHAQLESVLDQSQPARQQWFLFCDVEASLQEWAVTEDEVRNNILPTAPSDVRSKTLSISILTAIAAMALLTLALTLNWQNQSDTRPEAELAQPELLRREVAVLTHSVDAQWHDNVSLAAGTTLAPSILRLQSGALLIEFFVGATVVLEGPAEFEILSKTEGNLLSGKMNVHVPPQAQGFTIKTSAGEIVDHGTDFGVKMLAEMPHELHVFKGKVEFRSGNQSLDVQTGEAIELGGDSTEVFNADRSNFLIEQDLIQQSRLAASRRLNQWQTSSRILSEDPATVYHLKLNAASTTNRNEHELVNAAKSSPEISGGNLIGSQWVTGRWPGKDAILFGGPADRIRLNIAQPFKAITLFAWVNVQSLPRWQNSLLTADSKIPGSLQWQITKRGQLRLAIARDLGGPQSVWEAVESEPFLTDDRQRQWILLTTTFDGKIIRHYADGQPVGTGASYTPEEIHIGTAEIGNWQGETRRELNAIVDEMVIMNRVLSEREILEIHRYGQP